MCLNDPLADSGLEEWQHQHVSWPSTERGGMPRLDATAEGDFRPAAERLRETVNDLQLIVDTIPGLLVVLNASGRTERVNRGLLEYVGKPLENFFANTGDYVHPDDVAGVIAAWAQATSTGTMLECEHRLRRFDGVYRWFSVRARPLRDSANQVLRWYALFTDIDDHKRSAIDSIPGQVALLKLGGEADSHRTHACAFATTAANG